MTIRIVDGAKYEERPAPDGDCEGCAFRIAPDVVDRCSEYLDDEGNLMDCGTVKENNSIIFVRLEP